MEDIKVAICRLCLNFSSDNNYEVLKETSKTHISYVLPEINLSISSTPIICGACLGFLRDSYNFKTACVEIESYLEKFITPMKQLDLEEVIANKMFDGEVQSSNRGANRIICRLCLTVIYTDYFKEFGIIEENILQKCIPEIDLTLTEDPVSCENCMEYLHSHFNFIMKCLDVDERINNYLAANTLDCCNLHEVLQFSPERYIENVDDVNYNSYCDVSEDQKFEIKREGDGSGETDASKKEAPLIEDYLSILSSGPCNGDIYLKTENTLASKLLHKCEFCPYATNRKYSLRIHKLIHKRTEEVVLFRCPECPHETKRKSNLLIHLLKHKNPNEIRMHQCSECPYKTRLSVGSAKSPPRQLAKISADSPPA